MNHQLLCIAGEDKITAAKRALLEPRELSSMEFKTRQFLHRHPMAIGAAAMAFGAMIGKRPGRALLMIRPLGWLLRGALLLR